MGFESVVYEVKNNNNDHFVCPSCHGAQEIHVQEKLLKKYIPKGSVLKTDKTVIYGFCKEYSRV